MLILRTWLRYLVPLTLLAVIALAPIGWLALRSGAAPDLNAARAQLRLAWLLAGSAWAGQLLLVAGVAPAVRAMARGEPLSQWRALTAGLRGLLRHLVPWTIAICAIVIGGLALVVPGALLLALLALTGASDALGDPPPAALRDSIALARANLTYVGLVVASIVVVDLTIAYAAQLAIVPHLAKKVIAGKLVPLRTFVRAVAVSLVAVSPLAACTLAASYIKLRKS